MHGKMFKSGLQVLILLILFSFLSFSLNCKKPVSRSYTDVDAIKDYIYSHPSIFQSDVFDTTRNSSFYREITKRDYWIRINFHEADSIHFFRYADVYWDDSLGGVFHTFISGTEYLKNFKAFSRVRAYFEQWGDATDIFRGWLLMKVTNVQIYSTPSYSVGFSNLRVNYSGSDSSISTNALFDLSKSLQFDQSETDSVKFTIQAGDETDFYFLHIYEKGNWYKIPFKKISDDEFSSGWILSSFSQDLNIYKYAYIDCLDSKSAADSSYKYDSNAWGILYKIK
jgi:hypothetical protein